MLKEKKKSLKIVMLWWTSHLNYFVKLRVLIRSKNVSTKCILLRKQNKPVVDLALKISE